MTNNKQTGFDGEIEIISVVRCPNCRKELMLLPPNYPLYDVQCIGCSFRAQVKTITSKPKNVFLGAGWNIMEKVLKAGYIVPLVFKFQMESRPNHQTGDSFLSICT